jgi:hypothetical protein
MFSFDYAYRFRSNTLSDTLLIEVSDNCGQTWNSVFYKGGTELATFDTTWVNFRPFAAQHWEKFKVNILPQVDGESVIFRFKPINDLGSNLFIDNLFVYADENPESIVRIEDTELHIYPNPANSAITITSSNELEGASQLVVLDVLGQIVKKEATFNAPLVIDVNELPNGIYSVRLESKSGARTGKFVVMR